MSYIVLDPTYFEMFTGIIITQVEKKREERGRGQVVISAHAGWGGGSWG
jgi:hypothetical protein